MASGGSGGVSVPALWSEVNRYGQNGDFTRALKTVNKSKCPGSAGRVGGCSPLATRATVSEQMRGGETPAARQGRNVQPAGIAVHLFNPTSSGSWMA